MTRYNTVEVEYDGTVFVPTKPVCDLAAGTKCIVQLSPITMRYASPKPPPMTEEQERIWEEMSEVWRNSTWPWATVEQALGRPTRMES